MRHDAGIILLRILSFHAAYACRHSGACCTAGWIEPDDTGACRFHDAHPDGGCTIQRVHGHEAIPLPCQQFPRVATLSPLGTSVTLSAFCPTAASLMFGDEPFEIVQSPPARALEGLDARNVMPPLLRPGMLMDWDAVARWEELAVATLSDFRDDVERALAIIEAASENVCETWTPDQGGLSNALASAVADAGVFVEADLKDRRRDRSLARPQLEGSANMPASAKKALARYFASHAFACWPMYDGKGIRGALDWMATVRATLDEERRSRSLLEAFRHADLRLRHSWS